MLLRLPGQDTQICNVRGDFVKSKPTSMTAVRVTVAGYAWLLQLGPFAGGWEPAGK